VKVLTVIGNRPQFIKAAAVSPRLREQGQELLVHTGQHFDDALSAVFFAELGLPAPDVQLDVAGGSNTSQTARMLVELLRGVGEPVVLPLHPRTAANLERTGLMARLTAAGTVLVAPPLGYIELNALLCNARAVLTDSGGLQKEAYLAGVPCVTLRTTTEWVETVEAGWNTLVDLDLEAALASAARGAARAVRGRAGR
jgi:UDP-N-acetylglucosamine 2-epimerase